MSIFIVYLKLEEILRNRDFQKELIFASLELIQIGHHLQAMKAGLTQEREQIQQKKLELETKKKEQLLEEELQKQVRALKGF